MKDLFTDVLFGVLLLPLGLGAVVLLFWLIDNFEKAYDAGKKALWEFDRKLDERRVDLERKKVALEREKVELEAAKRRALFGGDNKAKVRE